MLEFFLSVLLFSLFLLPGGNKLVTRQFLSSSVG